MESPLVRRRTLIHGAALALAGVGLGSAGAYGDTGSEFGRSRERRRQQEECGEMHVYTDGPFPVTYAVYGQGEPVLMVTGMASVLDWFHFNIPAFVDAGYQVIAQDLRGANREGIPAAPGPYTTRDMAADSIGILDEVGVQRAHIVALSMGGMVAQHLAISSRERCERVSIVGNGLARVPADVGRQGQSDAGGSTRVGPTKDDVDEGLDAALEAAFTADFKEEHPERYGFFVDMYRQHHARPETLAAQIEAALGHDTLDDLHRISAPVQLLVGELDTINAAHVGEMAERIRCSEQQILPGMAHGLSLEDADVYNDLVLEFLGRAGRGEPTRTARG